MRQAAPGRTTWSLTTSYARVLLCITRDPKVMVREIAADTGLTLRTVQVIIRQLESDGALERRREGRRNVYRIIEEYRPKDPSEAGVALGTWLDVMSSQPDRR